VPISSRPVRTPLAIALCGLALLLAATAGAEPSATTSAASARTFAIRVVVPGQAGSATQELIAPPGATQALGGFAFPADASVVSTGPINSSVSSSTKARSATANAATEVASLSFFGGEVTVSQVVARATATAEDGEASGEHTGSAVVGLTVGGTTYEGSPGLRVGLGDWGYAVTLAQGAQPATDGFRGFVTALEVGLTAEHNGLPAGTVIQVGYADASARAPAAPPPPTTTRRTTTTTTTTAATTTTTTPEEDESRPPPEIREPPPGVAPRLTRGGYVFPIFGPVAFTDTFGAARAVVGWHHGEDIFAPLGAPVLAVAQGTVFSVGWNDLGGNRLWLRDLEGNEFYYAHLSAFSPLAVDGAHVRAGDVLGFVGNTGDAEHTPPHLHFEIHPVGLLPLGYDGVVPPYPILTKWQRLDDVRFVAGAGWVPSLAQPSNAPTPGAFLLSSSDISSASGLRPGALRRALVEQASSEALGDD
jgi:murein DD-endopeptidase MepM/ murein hydrolase activator NlpD